MKAKPSLPACMYPALAVLCICMGTISCNEAGETHWPDLMSQSGDDYNSGGIMYWLAKTDPCDPPDPWDPNEVEEPEQNPEQYLEEPEDVFPPGSFPVVYPSSTGCGGCVHITDGQDASMFVPSGWQRVEGGPLDGAYSPQAYFYIEGGPFNGMYAQSRVYHISGGHLNTTYSTMKLYHYDAGPFQSRYSRRDRQHITDLHHPSKYKPRGWIHVDSAGPSHTSYVPPDYVHYATPGPFRTAYLPPGWYHDANPQSPDHSKLKGPCP